MGGLQGGKVARVQRREEKRQEALADELAKLTERQPQPLDVCECGCFRREHKAKKGDWGKCENNGHTHPPCHQFQLSMRA